MKFTVFIAGFVALLGAPLALAAAQIKNAGLAADLVVPDRYIVKYKDNVDSKRRRDHEDYIDKKSKRSKKRGILHQLDLAGFTGYVVEISPEDMGDVMSSELVSCKPLSDRVRSS